MHHGVQKDDAFWDVQTQPAMGMLYRQPSNGDKSDVFFCPFTVQHILYLCNFPAQITLLVGLSNILDSKGREDISGSSPVKRTHGAGVAATLVGS